MPRLIGPDEASRTVFLPSGLAKAQGMSVPLYADQALSVPADVRSTTGDVIAGTPPTVLVDAYSRIPVFQFPDGSDTVWTSIGGGPPVALYARTDDRLDQLGATLSALDANATGRLGSIEAATVVLPAPTGIDDTAAINTVLAASAGRRVVGRPGATYLTSAPLVIRSGTTLDMTGCTVRLLPGSQCNLIHNAAVSTVRRLLDVAMTSGSAILTSAAGGFTAADVGQTVRVERAGAGGAKLVTTISAVTNVTTVTLATAASTTIATQYAAIGGRDTEITVIGGLWDRQNNSSSPIAYQPEAHSLRFRHVDGLVIRDLEHTATAGKYAIAPGDCTRIQVSGIRFLKTSSDGIHFNGPIDNAIVKDIQAVEMGDDLVSITANDTFIPTIDCFGDVTDIAIEDVSYRVARPDLLSSAVKIVAGQNLGQTDNIVVENIRVRNVTGPITTQSLVFIGDTNPINGTGGVFRNITVENVTSLGGFARYVVLLHRGTMEQIVLRGIRPHPQDLGAVVVDIPIDHLTIDDLVWKPSGTSFASGITLAETANVGHLTVAGSAIDFQGTSPAFLRMAATTRIGDLQIANCKLTTAVAGNITNPTAGAALERVQINNLSTQGFGYPAGEYRGTTQVAIANLTATGMTAWLYGRTATAAVTVVGASGLAGDVVGAGVAADAPGYVAVVPQGGTLLDGRPDVLASGEETVDRSLAVGDPQLVSGRLTLTYFTARKTEAITQVRTFSRGTATATPTLARVGVYLVAANGDLTLVASTANDTTMWAGTFAGYLRALTSTWTKQAGRRYAIAVLSVAATAPRLSGLLPPAGGDAPRINGSVDAQADLPASISNASVTTSAGTSVFAAMLP